MTHLPTQLATEILDIIIAADPRPLPFLEIWNTLAAAHPADIWLPTVPAHDPNNLPHAIPAAHEHTLTQEDAWKALQWLRDRTLTVYISPPIPPDPHDATVKLTPRGWGVLLDPPL